MDMEIMQYKSNAVLGFQTLRQMVFQSLNNNHLNQVLVCPLSPGAMAGIRISKTCEKGRYGNKAHWVRPIISLF